MSASRYSLAFVICAIPYSTNGEEEGEGRGQGGGGRREKEEGRRGGEKRDRQTDKQTERIFLAHALLSGGKRFISCSVQCCFTYGEGRGAQDGHLDFYTAPELWSYPSKQAKIQEREQK